jgi:hypothetical protein
MPHEFQKGQKVIWSDDALKDTQYTKANYGVGRFTVTGIEYVSKHERMNARHIQNVTVGCIGKCLIPTINSGKVRGEKCDGHCLITLPGFYFQPAANARKEKKSGQKQ